MNPPTDGGRSEQASRALPPRKGFIRTWLLTPDGVFAMVLVVVSLLCYWARVWTGNEDWLGAPLLLLVLWLLLRAVYECTKYENAAYAPPRPRPAGILPFTVVLAAWLSLGVLVFKLAVRLGLDVHSPILPLTRSGVLLLLLNVVWMLGVLVIAAWADHRYKSDPPPWL